MHVLTKRQALNFVRERSVLFDAAGARNPFACSAWVLHLIDQIIDDNWTIMVPECDSNGLSLLYRDDRAPYRLNALTNYYASLYSPLIGTAPKDLKAIANLADQFSTLHPKPSLINFAPLDAESTETTLLGEAFSDIGWYVRRYFCFGNWYLPCAGLGFDEYMNTRDSRLYNTWNRKAKKFRTRTDGARLETVTEPREVEAAMRAYDRVYSRSWKVAEPYPNFVRGWAKICAANGWLRLGVAWLGDVPIAAQFWFVMHRRASIFKLAYDEEYARLSAGTVLSAHLFKHVLERDRVIEVDYLSGDDPYKKAWMTHRRERIGLLACNLRTMRGCVTAAAEFAGAFTQRLRAAISNRPIQRSTE